MGIHRLGDDERCWVEHEDEWTIFRFLDHRGDWLVLRVRTAAIESRREDSAAFDPYNRLQRHRPEGGWPTWSTDPGDPA